MVSFSPEGDCVRLEDAGRVREAADSALAAAGMPRVSGLEQEGERQGTLVPIHDCSTPEEAAHALVEEVRFLALDLSTLDFSLVSREGKLAFVVLSLCKDQTTIEKVRAYFEEGVQRLSTKTVERPQDPFFTPTLGMEIEFDCTQDAQPFLEEVVHEVEKHPHARCSIKVRVWVKPRLERGGPRERVFVVTCGLF